MKLLPAGKHEKKNALNTACTCSEGSCVASMQCNAFIIRGAAAVAASQAGPLVHTNRGLSAKLYS